MTEATETPTPITETAGDLIMWLKARGLSDAYQAMAVMGLALLGFLQTCPDPRREALIFCNTLLSTLDSELQPPTGGKLQ